MKRLALAAALAATLSLCLFITAFAQENNYEEDYVTQAIEHIRQIETAYNRARDYLLNGRGTNEDNATSYQDLDELAESILDNEPPTALASTHQQILFATYRCQNFVSPASRVAREDLGTALADIYIIQLREYCIVQVNEAKLRLLDYTSEHNVNLFATLNEPIIITYTTPITTSEPITGDEESVVPDAVVSDDPVIYNVKWQVESVEDLGNSLSMGDADYLNFETRGRFIMLTMLLENVGDAPVSLSDAFYDEIQASLVDDQGRVFAQFDVGYALDELCRSIEINPGLSTNCVIPYEVSTDALGLSLFISLDRDGEEPQEAIIPLGID